MTRTLLVVLAAALLPLSAASARTLYWNELAVEALVDQDGRLRIREKHAMVFSGAWNGGERAFDVRSGQKLDLTAISRVDPRTGKARALSRGSLSVVDNYDWHTREIIRWRSRLPTDPEYDDTEIVYVIEYLLSGVLIETDGAYRLDHDFAFPDRVGNINSFRLDLDFDPAWELPDDFARTLERTALVPGESVVVTVDLAYRGDGEPGAVLSFLPTSLRLLPLAIGLLAVAVVARAFLAHENKQGRYSPTEAPEHLDRSWLDEVVFSLRPEVAGALWDGTVTGSEVSALIARWVQEGRVESRVREADRWWKQSVLELELKTDRDKFIGYERMLLDKLFFRGRSTTDTESIRQRYKTSGFSPVATIRPSIERRLRDLPGMGRTIGGPDRTPGCLLMIVFVALVALEYWQGGDSALVLVATLILGAIVPTAIAYVLAYRYRRKGDDLGGALLWLAVPLAVLFLVLLGTALAPGSISAFSAMRLGGFGLFAIAVFFVMVSNGALNTARTRESKARVARRKQLTWARKLFARELLEESPTLDDDWLPYLVAFGLDKRVDRWSRTFGGSSSRHASTTSSGSIATGGTGGNWTGGGGAFGGAGATAAWTAAAGGIAAGVSRPSSGGGSSGGGGGGGGSSGGGGGGGW